MDSAQRRDPSSSASARLDELLNNNSRIEELSSATEEEEDEDSATDSESDDGRYNVHGWLGNKAVTPRMFSALPFLHDELVTGTSEAQDRVAAECMALMSGLDQEITDLNSHGIPRLQKQKHIDYLHKSLGDYPPPYQGMDASRPWILYWALAGLASLGQDVSKYRTRTIQTFTPMQNATGGFGGGHGQLSHCAASYAATLSLALVDGLHIIDRRTMWQWLGSVKQADGGFTMAVDGEEDVRGAYCSMTIITLLNLPLALPPGSPALRTGDETFVTNLGEWYGRCQTFEGGIGGAPDTEAHGAYAFCCLAGLSLLDAPHRSLPRYLDVNRLAAWLSSRQSAPEGGLSGRSNKLVDACYSHWVGGCWALLEAALLHPRHEDHTHTNGDSLLVTQSLWNREALVRYTLCCSQTKKGGLRDKPGTRVDGYHTCYSLAGLSTAQNHWDYIDGEHVVANGEVSNGDLGKTAALTAAFNWTPRRANEAERKAWAFDETDTVGFVHPVFVLPLPVVKSVREQFEHVIGL